MKITILPKIIIILYFLTIIKNLIHLLQINLDIISNVKAFYKIKFHPIVK